MLLQVAVVLSSVLPAQCSSEAGSLGPAAGESIVLAVATGRVESVPVPVDQLLMDALSEARRSARLGSGADLRRPVSIATDVRVVAHEFVVRRASSPNPMRQAWGTLAPADTFLAVPWAYDTTCNRHAWEESRWVPSGAAVVFRVDLARKYERRRVIDVLGWHDPYPFGRLLGRGDALNTPADIDEWLPASQVFRILSEAPRPDSPDTRGEQLQRLESVYRSGPMAMLERFPGPEILRLVRVWAASGSPPSND